MIDAIKEAIEAMDKSKPYMSAYSPDRKMIDKAIAALQALQSGEPVALWSLRQLAQQHDGKFHGPNVEHLSIPEHNLLGFANAIIAKYTTPQPVVPEGYAYKTIEEYEQLVGHKVNEAFRTGFDMARIMERQFDLLSAGKEAGRE
jgi:hypothetical protein